MSTLGDARSPAGHAAYSMRGQDDHWVIIQRQTFTNWANEQLKSVDMDIKDLDTDFCDGIRLCALMEVLQKRRIGRYVKKPINQHQYLDNVSLALKAIEHDNIKLVNIGNEDIVNGNRKLILGMVWSLILHYQIGKSGIPPKKLMLAWLQAVIPECGISNFSRDWNDGVALNALVEYCKPGLAPKWRSLRRADGLNNCRTAMNLAKEHFNIPLVLSPENLTNPDLDELSGMTYLSYFMKVDSPGYNATLNWVQSQVQYPQITNFQTDWNDGQALTALVKSLGGNIPPGGASDPSVVTETAMNVAEQQLSVLPVIPASEMTSGDVDHLGVMAYTAWFQHRSPSVPIRAPTPPPVIVPPPSPPVVVAPPRPVVPPSNMVTITPHQRETYPNNLVTFLLDIIDSDADKESVRIEVIGPSTKPDCTVNWHGGQGTGQFVPSEPGHHMIMVYNEGEAIQGCPVDINVRIDASHIHLTTPLQSSMSNHSSMIIGLDAAKVAQGAVRVEARSPSGRITDMSVVENQGVFTANFTPTEVGDWMVSIMYDNQHIQGSPFNVRVYDASQVKVFGLEGGTVGKMFGFSADCSNAGDGELTVDIKHNGRSVTATTTQESRGIYRIHFTPDGSGLYTIRVFFAGMEVSGSPYTLEIVDTSMVSAKGEGLSSVEINRKASFLVETHGASGGNIRATVTNANGSLVPCDVQNNGNGTFTVEYVPSIVGEHHIDVTYYDKPIIGSPFTVSAFDWRRITVENLSNSSMMGRMVEFDIDTSHSGRGDLEIMVNDGTIPCSVQNRGNRRFHAAFTPKESIPHYIQMRFQGKDVPGSPWTVDVRGITKVTVAGPGLDLVPIGRQTHFEARAIGSGTFAAHSLTASITGPTRKSVPVQIGNNFNGTYRLDYTPLEVGAHTIEVMYEGMPIDNSPFTSRAYHAPAISVSNIQPGIVGRQVEFNIDVTQAGEGQLEISVNNGTVPNSVKNLQKGVYMVRFVPRELRSHLIEIKFNGELLPRCPITVPIMDASRVTVQGDGIKQVAVNRQSYFHVNTKSAGDADLSVRVTAPSGVEVANNLKAVEDGYEVSYNATEVGNHRIDIEYADVIIPGSPFWVKTFDPTKVMVTGVKDGVVGKQSSFVVDVNHAGEGNMEISIRDSEQVVPNSVRQLSRGKFDVLYTPTNSGEHQANVTFNSQHVSGSPYGFRVVDASKVTASGDGLKLAPCNKYSSFRISAQGAREADLDVKITNAAGRVIPMRMSEVGIGTFNVEWLPTDTGDHKIDVKYLDMPIKDSPFSCQAWDHNQVVVSGISPGRVAKASYFNIDASRAGRGNLEIIVSVNGENVPNFVKQVPNVARFEVSFTPQGSEAHNISVKFNNESVPGSPFLCEIIGTSKIHRLGSDLLRVPRGKKAVISIDPKKAGSIAESAVMEVVAPSDQVIIANVSYIEKGFLKAEFVPVEVGPHCITVTIADIEIAGSPFVCEVYDTSKVRVSQLSNAVVGKPCEFEVDGSRAGAGDIDVLVRNSTSKIQHKLLDKGPNIHKVYFIPKEPDVYKMYVTFSKESIRGSPFVLDVEDGTMVVAHGRSLEASPVHTQSSFFIDPSNALFRANAVVRITSPPPSCAPLQYSIMGDFMHGWTVNFIPHDLGVHLISIQYGDSHIVGSPFKCRVYDLTKVRIIKDDLTPGLHVDGLEGGDVVFYVDASEAGSGNLEVVVRCTRTGQRIPNFLEASDRPGCFRIYFTPRPDCFRYEVDVTFNEDQVHGSPFICSIVDGAKAQATGGGLKQIPANRPTQFNVNTFNVGEADIYCTISSPSNVTIPYRISGSHLTSFNIEYTPTEVGRHRIDVKYADADIMGSPFYPEVFDASLVKVGNVPHGVIGQWVYFDVDCSLAGEGTLTVDVHGVTTQPMTDVKPKGSNQFTVGFVPKETSPQTIHIVFNQEPVPGSPFTAKVLDTSSVTLLADMARAFPVHRPVAFELETGGITEAPVDVIVSGPTGKQLTCNLTPGQSANRRMIEFTPLEVGGHTLSVNFAGQPIKGSPFTCYSYDASRVRIVDITSPAKPNEPLSFTVDTSSAGSGDIDVEVAFDSQLQQLQRHKLDDYRHQFTFTPPIAATYSLSVMFNYEKVPDTPMPLPVADNFGTLSLGADSQKIAAVNEPSWSSLLTQGSSIEMTEVVSNVTAPNGEQVPAKIVQQPDGDYKVEYASKYTGRHTVEILYAGQAIMGSPFYVEIYDPKKIRVEGVTTAGVGEQVSFDIIRHEAGKADLGLTITSPSGRDVPFEITPNQHGEHVTYVAQEAGSHQIYLTYGGLEVAAGDTQVVVTNIDTLPLKGSPFQQIIGDSASIEASGDGLIRAEQDKTATFFVNTGGAKGDLFVQVDGPNSIARCKIEPDRTTTGRYIVTYTPVEVGMYTVTIKWNDREVASSPFRVGVVDAAKVNVIGGWHSLVDTSNRMTLVAGHQKRMEFDVTDAGPGVLTAAVHGPYGAVQVDLQQKGNIVTVAFTPTTEGEHQVSLWWSEVALPRSPLVGIVGAGGAQRSMNGSMRSEQHVMSGQMSMDTIRVEKVILTGSGLAVAKVKEMAEFVIDGTDAGPGQPDVKLTGVKQDIDIETTPLGGNKYRCTYVPNLPGGYLLNIMWSDRQVRGSPYKVTVTDQCDASKVVCSGEGLTQGIVGKEIKSIIDTRRAGPGELTAHCMGPSLLAFCELYNHHDGTFTLNVKPQEPGRHMLEVKYGGIHVPNSPFELHVQGAPDASKVRVAGPGIDHGILARYHSRFTVETRGAGAGQLTVRIRGPKAAFRVEMQRQSQKDRTILCRYDPTEVGDYIIYVKWSGQHVPGSPFHVHIFDTEEELQNLLMSNPQGLTHPGTLGSKGSWAAEI